MFHNLSRYGQSLSGLVDQSTEKAVSNAQTVGRKIVDLSNDLGNILLDAGSLTNNALQSMQSIGNGPLIQQRVPETTLTSIRSAVESRPSFNVLPKEIKREILTILLLTDINSGVSFGSISHDMRQIFNSFNPEEIKLAADIARGDMLADDYQHHANSIVRGHASEFIKNYELYQQSNTDSPGDLIYQAQQMEAPDLPFIKRALYDLAINASDQKVKLDIMSAIPLFGLQSQLFCDLTIQAALNPQGDIDTRLVNIHNLPLFVTKWPMVINTLLPLYMMKV